MSSINFEKASGKEYLTHKEIDANLTKYQDKKRNELIQLKQENAAQRYSNDHQWMLPNIEKKLSGDVGEIRGKLKKEAKKSKKDKHSRKSTSSSDSERQKPLSRKKKINRRSKKHRKRTCSSDSDSLDEGTTERKREDWMSLESVVPIQSSGVLNTYWKDGGSSIPKIDKECSLKTTIGDKGLEYYERYLKRAQEIASEEKRSLADVVSERWGCLQNLTDLITNAKKERTSSSKGTLQFQKPGSEFGRFSFTNNEDKKGNWTKNSIQRKEKSRSEITENENVICNKVSDLGQINIIDGKSTVMGESSADGANEKPFVVLNDDDLNKLAAKLVKAEILGKTDQVMKLKKELDAARAARETAIKAAGSVGTTSDETVVLVQSSSKGLTRPYERPTLAEPSKGRRKKKNVDTHRDGKRVCYFPDDDQRDLKQMFETEKFSSHDEDKALFLKLSKKHTGVDVEEDDAAFADAARVSESAGKQQQRDFHQAVQETQQRRKKVDNCRWCFGCTKLSKNLIVSLGKKSYLCLPVSPLTSLHCQIVPLEHSISGTQLDEDIWEEIHDFRKSLIAMAKALNHYAIFFEDARGFKRLPHMIMQCILIDKKRGELAPIYFKKSLLDCEGDWTTNKKVVDIKGNDIRRTIPKGLPYFSVEFPPDGGFAHVIENEDRFPSNFAQSVIGGMLDIDHRLWRNPNRNNDSAMAQRERTIEFSRKFLKYDFTSKSKSSSSSSSSTTSSDSE